MTMITLRTGSGSPKATVEVAKKQGVGLRSTHNGDGRFTYAVALGVDGNYYETKPRGGGWRVIVDPRRRDTAKAALSQ